MKTLAVCLVSMVVLLSGCTSPAAEPPADEPQPLRVSEAGVTVSGRPGAVPPGTDVSILRKRTANPVARADLPALATLAPVAEIDLDGGRLQPRTPLTVAIDVPRASVRGSGPIGVVLQSDGGKPEFVPGRYDKKSARVVVKVPHLSSLWPVQLDVGAMVRDGFTYVVQATGIETEEPDCADDQPTIDGMTYSVIQPAQAWVCLRADGSDLQVDVTANSPVPFDVASSPRSATVQPITDLGDESVVGAAIARALSRGDQGLIGPGVSTRLTYDGAQATTLDFRSAPPLLLVQVVIATLQPILDTKRIETLGKAKCFHDIVQTAQRTEWNVSTAASLTSAVLSCVGEVVALTPVGAVILALLSAAPQAFAGTFLGLFQELSGQGSFEVVIEEQEEVLSSPRQVCRNDTVLRVVRGMSCEEGEEIIAQAVRAFDDLEEGELGHVGDFTCDYPAYLGDIICRHDDDPRGVWVREASE